LITVKGLIQFHPGSRCRSSKTMVFTNRSLDGLHIISVHVLNMFVWMDLTQTSYLYHLMYHKVQCLDPCCSLSTPI